MSDKIASYHVVKIGIVTDNLEETARAYEKLFDAPVQVLGPEDAPPFHLEAYKRYRGQAAGDIQMKCALVHMEPVYLEIVQPTNDTPSPWLDHLKRFGTSVCFVSFYIQGFEQHVDLLERSGFPLQFVEEKGFERYGYFDTMAKLGLTVELKEQIPLEEKQ